MSSNRERRAPANTQKETKEHPLLMIGASMGSGGPGQAVEEQEAAGQGSFVGSDTLPADVRGDTKAILEAAGVKFLGEVEGDAKFQYVELPEGWKKVATDHSLWSHLYDERWRKRAAMFYKAAFYDRDAFIRAECRYSVDYDYDRAEAEGVAVGQVMDCGEVIHSMDPMPIPPEDDIGETTRTARAAAEAWLDGKFPDWRDPAAYWE